ncbi:substrate-binding domain-containing protein [Micromonospora sp. DT47]|uniref:substrate-binding domain-containing protein n=1 Tax=Micromonospora sp. DT47 TaxID=3393431 RepID=UPI003CECB38F
MTLSCSVFFGMRERAEAFRTAMGAFAPELRIVVLPDANGLDEAMAGLVRSALAEHPGVRAIYSVGGGNRAIAAELVRAGLECEVFLGHDLDEHNVDLLRAGTLHAVLHHDLRADTRAALRQVLRHHRLLAGAPTSVPAGVEVVTPYNIPARLRPV